MRLDFWEGPDERETVLLFSVLLRWVKPPSGIREKAFLIEDRWDDWSKFQTMFTLVVFDESGQQYEPGSVKIGQRGLQGKNIIEPGCRAPHLDREFDTLGDDYFSLGMSENYYETLTAIPGGLGLRILDGLKDCALDLERFEVALPEEVMRESLLRSISVENVRNRFNRLANGNAILTEFQFEYEFPGDEQGSLHAPILTFHVQPRSEPPTNVHVLIGRNGVGKTRCMQFLAQALVRRNELTAGEVRQVGREATSWSFSSMVAVSFSAFDNFVLPQSNDVFNNVGFNSEIGMEIRTFFIGLHQMQEGVDIVKTPDNLADDFVRSFDQCRLGLRRERWQAAIETLENDPLFAEAKVTTLLQYADEEWRANAKTLFKRLSSGHAIVLLTVTRLVELVDERTLVLLDEPEGHLHPPLLSAFVRTLSDLLIKRNGVAIVATHSPVVLQEVPRSCVWVLRRTGHVSVAERPTIETFGENVGVLTREVFGLEVTHTGFHKLLLKAVEDDPDYENVLHRFSGQIGAEAKAIVMGLIANRNSKDAEKAP